MEGDHPVGLLTETQHLLSSLISLSSELSLSSSENKRCFPPTVFLWLLHSSSQKRVYQVYNVWLSISDLTTAGIFKNFTELTGDQRVRRGFQVEFLYLGGSKQHFLLSGGTERNWKASTGYCYFSSSFSDRTSVSWQECNFPQAFSAVIVLERFSLTMLSLELG